MPRFFVHPDAIRGQTFTLTGSEARHAAMVLRKKVGDVIDLFDGKDLSYQGRIDSVSVERIAGTLVEQQKGMRSPEVELILCQALIKGSRWDWLVEKACEIGVTRLVPVITARTIVKPSREGSRGRWKRIALAAAKQSGRTRAMEIDVPRALTELLTDPPIGTLSLIPWEKETKKTVRQAIQEGRKVKGEGGLAFRILVGPEGGWDSAEVDLAVRHAAIPVCLGPMLLRSETAGLVAATLVMAERGDDA